MNKVIIAVVILVALLSPLAIIWSLNTLFPILAIPYTFYTWLAAFVIIAIFTPQSSRSN